MAIKKTGTYPESLRKEAVKSANLPDTTAVVNQCSFLEGSDSDLNIIFC